MGDVHRRRGRVLHQRRVPDSAPQSMAAVEAAAVKVPSNKSLIAQQLRRQTPMSRQWIADRLRMGSASYVSNLLQCR
jgi:hypothetical protein